MEFITNPQDIEKKSFEIITEILGDRVFEPMNESVIKRVIHTSADFDYADNLCFSENAVNIGLDILRAGADIVTDTQMAKSGINKKSLAALNCTANCFIDNEDVARTAKESGMTRAATAVDYAVHILNRPAIFVVGNAPTALIKLHELISTGVYTPAFIIGVPVGFVNVVESKELIMSLSVPFIVAKGRKGGSNVAAAIVNALMYNVK